MPVLRPAAHGLATRLRQVAPRARILSDPAQLSAYASDGLGHKRFPPDLVAIPADAAEVVALARELAAANVPVIPRGAGTSLCGGPVAAQGGVILHLSRLRTIREINPENRYAEVDAGVVLDRLDAALAPFGLYYPPDPSTGPVCTLGGNVASNAGGVHCFRYGVTANYVLGVETILPDGTLHRFGGPSGGRGGWRDDWKRIFVGSEGTLGIFTRLWLRLIARPEKVWTFRATYRGLEQASEAIRGLANHPSFPAAIEFMDPRCVDMVENSPLRVGLPRGRYMVLAEIDGPAPLVDARLDAVAERMRRAGADDVSIACEPDKRRDLWKARKCLGGLLGQAAPSYAVQDAVIPKRRLGEMLDCIYRVADAAGLPTVTLMHAGDGNLHPNFLFDDRNPDDVAKVEAAGKALMKKVSELGGTLSGEHGIGNDKADYTAAHFGPLGGAMQMSIPDTFNPSHRLNPLKVFPQRRFAA